MFILDFSSGETCKNNIDYACRMIDEIPGSEKDIVIKWQLFENIPPLTPLDREVYLKAREYARGKGYKTGSSFFDKDSLEFLKDGNADFVKMAARPRLYHLLDLVPTTMPLVVSVQDFDAYNMIRKKYPRAKIMCCIANYPARVDKYWRTFPASYLARGISDHTDTWELYQKCHPDVYECHYCLDDSTGPDAASFARRPAQLREVL